MSTENYADNQVISIARNLLEVATPTNKNLVGYNRYDLPIVQDILKKDIVYGSDVHKVYNILYKYKYQLKHINIIYEDLDISNVSALNREPIDTKNTVIRFTKSRTNYLAHLPSNIPYDVFQSIKDLLKLNGFSFNKEKKAWSGKFFRYSTARAFYNTTISLGVGVDFTSEIVETLKELKKEELQSKWFIELSHKTHHDLSIPNINGSLYSFQNVPVEYSKFRKSIFITDEMGVGKTLQSVGIFCYHALDKIVIVCPSLLKRNWYKEIKKWSARDLKIQIVEGKSSELNPDANIYIINYDIIHSYASKFKKIKIQMAILDESHYIKNPDSQRSKGVNDGLKHAEFKVLLTGTPILNKPMELISQLEFLGVMHKFGGRTAFKQNYCDMELNDFGYTYGSSNEEDLQEELRRICMIRRQKVEVLPDLPEKTKQVLYLPIKNRKLYEEVEKNAITWFKEKIKRNDSLSEEEKREALAKKQNRNSVEQLQRIEYLKQAAVELKMESVFEWIDNTLEESKLVVYVHHETTVNALLERYNGRCIHLVGGMSKKADKIVEEFQGNDEVRLFIAGLTAAAAGVTLTAADKLAFIELGWNPGIHGQAEDRIHRISQTKKVNIYYLLAEYTIEEDIYDLIISKEETIDATMNIDKLIKKIEERRKLKGKNKGDL